MKFECDTETEGIAVLKHISKTLDKVLETLLRPRSKLVQIFDTGAIIVTLLGIFAIIDVILSWIRGW